MRKLVASVGVVAALLVVMGGSASAQYNGDATLTCTPLSVAVGDNLSRTATGYEPGGTVTFRINGAVLGTAVADANGVASITAPVPTGTPTGAATVTSTGPGAGGGTTELVLNTNITVTAAALDPVQPAGQLPATGSDSSLPIAQIAVVLIAAGGLAVLVARRRSTTGTEVSV